MSGWKLNTDGGSRGNPGKGAWAFLLRSPTGQVFEHGGPLDMVTNNSAEYEAVIQGLSFALAEGVPALDVYSDSELIVKQIRGEYKVRNADLAPMHEEVKKMMAEFSGAVRFHHIPREQNKEADRICNLVMDGKFRGSRPGGLPAEKPSAPARPTPAAAAYSEETLAAVRAIFHRFGASISEDQAEEAIAMMRQVLGMGPR